MSEVLTSQNLTHIPVLGRKAPETVVTNPDGIYVDATFGRGGHSRKILELLSDKGRLIAFDRDAAAIEAASSISDTRFTIYKTAFSRMKETLLAAGVDKVSGVLMDIGVSSPQIDDASRGFTFSEDGPLDMRMDQTTGQTAAEWLAGASETEIETVLREDGEERYARRIAAEIVRVRKEKPIERTGELAQLIARIVPKSRVDNAQHPATRSFQAIRIHVNRELAELREALEAAGQVLASDGRLAIISFHSLEDRIVKNFFITGSNPGRSIDARLPLREKDLPAALWRDVKRVMPDEDECRENPRARSAVMRVAVRTSSAWPDAGGVR